MSRRRRSNISRPGFTILELIVVLAILAVLFALTLAAIQRARDAANRTTCMNNLRQIGLGLHHYHDSLHRFPPGVSYRSGADAQPFMGWPTRLLPYLGQGDLWRQAEEAFRRDKIFWMEPHSQVRSTVVSTFSCPADGRTLEPAVRGRYRIGLTSYLGVEGTNQFLRNGVLFMDSRVCLDDVQDGTSHTLAVGERPPSSDLVYGWWYAGWGQGQDGSLDSVLGANEVNVFTGLGSGCPRGPYQFSPGSVGNYCDAFHFWSPHSAGANFLFADGSVRLMSYAAERQIAAMATRAGREPVVWSD